MRVDHADAGVGVGVGVQVRLSVGRHLDQVKQPVLQPHFGSSVHAGGVAVQVGGG